MQLFGKSLRAGRRSVRLGRSSPRHRRRSDPRRLRRPRHGLRAARPGRSPPPARAPGLPHEQLAVLGADADGDPGRRFPRARGDPRPEPLRLLAASRRAPGPRLERLFHRLGRRRPRLPGVEDRPSLLPRRRRRARRIHRVLRGRVRGRRAPRAARSSSAAPPSRTSSRPTARSSRRRTASASTPGTLSAGAAGTIISAPSRGTTSSGTSRRPASSGRAMPLEVFQVDDGYEHDIGDWTRAKPGYPGPRRAGRGHHQERLPGRDLDGALQRRRDLRPLRRPPRVDGGRGRPAQVRPPELGPEDPRPRPDAGPPSRPISSSSSRG